MTLIDGNDVLRGIVAQCKTKEPLASYRRVYVCVSTRIFDAWSRGLPRVTINMSDAHVGAIDVQYVWDDCVAYVRRKLLKNIPETLVKVRRLGARELLVDWSLCLTKTSDATRAVYVGPSEASEQEHCSSRDVVSKVDEHSGVIQLYI